MKILIQGENRVISGSEFRKQMKAEYENGRRSRQEEIDKLKKKLRSK